MFSTSTQSKCWIFKDEAQISRLRKAANDRFISRQQIANRSPDDFLSPEEERTIYKHYEFTLRDFCKKFQPPVPRSVIGTSFHYFKRFYLNNSVMDYHPKHMLQRLVQATVKCLPFAKWPDVNEMRGHVYKKQSCSFYHQTRCSQFPDPEKLRIYMDDFLERTLFTDAMLLMAPSQIALTAVLYAANKAQANFETYITDFLFAGSPRETLHHIKDTVKKLWLMVRAIEVPPKEKVRACEQKLEKCRNQENNPDSQV
ncbi:hypothetical protein HPB52_013320 [Rhipicephalus sanguineus]|uniref:Cyclin C-terminal domain-containing protein n=1 Tax=Rhipicephalus sanguineus TaxID=34632 RepID=A0A9D4PRS9_RHISA|nr:hypothetical protein HPB52_013320 [Rhipicephalus sanguineus]